jgi:hypothetical protein
MRQSARTGVMTRGSHKASQVMRIALTEDDVRFFISNCKIRN